MKIIDRTAFLKLPPETVYSLYAPCVFDGLFIKGETIKDDSGQRIDLLYQDLIHAIESEGSGQEVDILTSAEISGERVEMDYDCQGRDGSFNADQLFAVLEHEDVSALILRLQASITPKT